MKREHRHVWAAVRWAGDVWIAQTTSQPEIERAGETIGAALGALEAALADRVARGLDVLDGTTGPDVPHSYLVARILVREDDSR